jgi:hypothetical protein
MCEENKSYISGIYNYCDRWCEKCSFTSNCLLFTDESKMATHEILNNGELPDFEKIFNLNIDSAPDGYEEIFDESIADEELDAVEEEKELDNSPINKLTEEYFINAHSFIKKIYEKYNLCASSKGRLKDRSLSLFFENIEIINWYHPLITAKIKRALAGKIDLRKNNDDDEMNEFMVNDINGSAKVAIIALNKSIKALNNLFDHPMEFINDISDLLVFAGNLLNELEKEFPHYKEFIRPGFDEQ